MLVSVYVFSGEMLTLSDVRIGLSWALRTSFRRYVDLLGSTEGSNPNFQIRAPPLILRNGRSDTRLTQTLQGNQAAAFYDVTISPEKRKPETSTISQSY